MKIIIEPFIPNRKWRILIILSDECEVYSKDIVYPYKSRKKAIEKAKRILKEMKATKIEIRD